ncbi:MAG: hypothetical protein ACLU5K_03100 [Christensenellales bacterium]
MEWRFLVRRRPQAGGYIGGEGGNVVPVCPSIFNCLCVLICSGHEHGRDRPKAGKHGRFLRRRVLHQPRAEVAYMV